jgi:hypothetical protein
MAHAATTPLAVVGGWLDIIQFLYDPAAPTTLIGRTSIRRWALAIAGDTTAADIMWVGAAALLFSIPCGAALVEARRRMVQTEAAVPALFCLWSLLVWFHLGNNLVLMFPAFTFLLLLDDPPTALPRFTVAAVMQSLLMLDVPVHFPGYSDRLGPLDFLVLDADRILAIGVFFYLAALWYRLRARRSRRDTAKFGIGN